MNVIGRGEHIDEDEHEYTGDHGRSRKRRYVGLCLHRAKSSIGSSIYLRAKTSGFREIASILVPLDLSQHLRPVKTKGDDRHGTW
jgi:hypothetical protein